MRATCVLALAAVIVPWQANGQSAVISNIGETPIVEINSTSVPDVLKLIQSNIQKIGFGAKWSAGQTIAQDVVVADEVVFERGKSILISPKAINDRNVIVFIGKRIRVIGPADAPLSIAWDTANISPLRDPPALPKAANGIAGVREGERGQDGASGIGGNKGYRGQDAPSLIFVANEFDITAPVTFKLNGQVGGQGGPGQDGGDGGAGAPGRPGLPNMDGIGIKTSSQRCRPEVKGGDGGNGGRGGDGGLGGRGGDGGAVAIVGPAAKADSVKRFVHRESTLRGGEGGTNGEQGIGGAPGKGAPLIPGVDACPASEKGIDGIEGDGRQKKAQAAKEARQAKEDEPVRDHGSAGLSGSFSFVTLTASQATSVGLR